MKFRPLLILALVSGLSVFTGACNVDDEPVVAANNGDNNGVAEPCESGRAACSDSGECVPSTTIGSGQGGASDSTFSCMCDTGYTGDICLSCDTGYEKDASDACVPSPTCDDVDCGNGTCELGDDGPACVCETGWTGDACDACEDGTLEHEADSGICVTDLCADAPCDTAANATAGSCTMPTADSYECGCDAEYLWNAGICEAQCTDVDQDGYGVGPACLGTDCLDSNVSVWEENQISILKSELAGGVASVTTSATGTVAVDLEYLFTRDSANPTNSTKIMAAYYSPGSHYLPMGGCLIVEQAPLACEAGGTVGVTTVNVPVPLTDGDYELRIFEISDAEANCAVAASELLTSTMTDLGTKIGDVTVTTNQCVPGRMSISNVRFNGAAVNRYVATPGESVVLTVDWATAEGGCTGCVAPAAIGWQGNRIGCPYAGNPGACSTTGGWPHSGANLNYTITAPTAPGIYQLGWDIKWVYNCSDISFNSMNPFTTWGVLEVQ